MSSRHTYVIAMTLSLWLHLRLPYGRECNPQMLQASPAQSCSPGPWHSAQETDFGREGRRWAQAAPMPSLTTPEKRPMCLHAHGSLGSMLVPASSTRSLSGVLWPSHSSSLEALLPTPSLRVPIEKEES